VLHLKNQQPHSALDKIATTEREMVAALETHTRFHREAATKNHILVKTLALILPRQLFFKSKIQEAIPWTYREKSVSLKLKIRS
tara:strand:- start:1287 stop:1538 length:252 start_codon:yes stop_codon:yes gene_type:complete